MSVFGGYGPLLKKIPKSHYLVGFGIFKVYLLKYIFRVANILIKMK